MDFSGSCSCAKLGTVVPVESSCARVASSLTLAILIVVLGGEFVGGLADLDVGISWQISDFAAGISP